MQRITLDFFNDVADVSLDGVDFLFNSTAQFKELTGFDYPDALLIAVEVERGIFIVERAGGVVDVGRDIPEIDWLVSNIESIKDVATREMQSAAARELEVERVNSRIIAIATTDWMVIRHRDQLDLETPTSLTSEQYQQLLLYRQQLRDAIPGSDLPQAPAFLAVEGS